MSPKSRHHKGTSKGSRSLFSADLWRSIRRAGSRSVLHVPGIELDLTSAPAFQCDPSQQIPSYVTTAFDHDCHPSVQTPASTSLRTLYLRSSNKPCPAISEEVPHRQKSRPLSWLSLTRHKTTMSDADRPLRELVLQSSKSSTSHSQIGTPILTSTTNARVADSENVEYSEVLLPYYSVPEHPVSADDPRTSDSDHVQYSIVHPSTWSSTVRSMKKKLVHKRRASTSVLSETPWSRRMAEIKSRINPSSAYAQHGLHPMHAYKDIFHRHRHDSSSSQIECGMMISTQGDLNSLRFTSGNKSTPDFRLPPRLPGLYSESNTDLLAPSLAKSFAIAVDKLDFNSSPTLMSDGTPISKLKKAKSYLSLHRFVREYSDRTLDKSDVVVSSSPAVIVKNRNSEKIEDSLLTEGPEDMYKPKIRASKPIQLRFSGRKKRYVPSKPDTNSPSGVNPLRMHPEVSSAADVSSQITPTTPVFPEDSDGRASGSIDRAVIYSPSTGNLSVYSRTPSPRTQITVPKERMPQDTPTRKPLHKVSGSKLRKSVSTFFGKSAGMIKVANVTPMRNSQSERNIITSRQRTASDTKLLDSRAVAEVRVRSLSTPQMQNARSTRAPWSHQPSTPSPLRKSTMIDASIKGRQRAVTTTNPTRPSAGIMLDKARSNSVLSNPEKRYGRYIDHADAPKVLSF